MLENIRKIIITGPSDNKDSVLKKLQNLSLIEVEPYTGDLFKTDGRATDTTPSENALSAFKSIEKIEQRTKESDSLPEPSSETPEKIIKELPNLLKEESSLKDRETNLKNKLYSISPWGNFDLTLIRDIEKKGNIHIQFWDVSFKDIDEISIDEAIASIEISRDPKRCYFITFSESPLSIKGCIEEHFDKSKETILEEIEQTADKREKIKNKLFSFISRKDEIYKIYLREKNRLNLHKAASGSVSELDDRIFMLTAWCPEKNLETVEKALIEEKSSLFKVKPEKDEQIPTLLRNNSFLEMGEDVVKIYDTPSYSDWDPTSWVFFSFTLFFAMIIADGGYGIVMFLLMLFFKIKVKKPAPTLKRFFNLSLWLSGATIIYGIITGSYFGMDLVSPAFSFMNPVTDFLKKIRLFDTTDTDTMMLLSIWIGMLHINLSLILKGIRSIIQERKILPILINITWIAAIWAFYFWYGNKDTASAASTAQKALTALGACGGALVVLYSISTKTLNPFKMLFTSFMGLYNSVQFFADILSYIRIFALGLSGTLLAQTFNDLSIQVMETGSAGIVFAPLIFLLGHTLNIAICIMGGVIHGLRLNFLEYYRWSFDGGGRPFRAFRNLLMSNNN
ncbi:MAG: V-type ATPase 116kDa subunit family protein [bacterium]